MDVGNHVRERDSNQIAPATASLVPAGVAGRAQPKIAAKTPLPCSCAAVP